MHPHLMNELARQRTGDLRATMDGSRPHLTTRGPRGSVRHRAGWTLVEIGLRLAGPSAR